MAPIHTKKFIIREGDIREKIRAFHSFQNTSISQQRTSQMIRCSPAAFERRIYGLTIIWQNISSFQLGEAFTLPAGQQIHRRVIYVMPRRKEVIFIELIFHTYQSPHIGSKLCFAKGTQLISSPLSILQSLEVLYRQWRIRHLEFQGAQRREY